jgi:HAD superfamily phosphoserine phosphatase-like hydrolase
MHLFDHPHLQCKLDKVRLLCFDVDGTLIDDHGGHANLWESLHRAFGVTEEERRRIADDFFSGRITYADWVDLDVGRWQALGVTRNDMLDVIRQLQPVRDAPETIAILAARGYRLAVISGSIDLGLEALFPQHPFDPVLINRIVFDPQGRIAHWHATPFDLSDKEKGLQMIAAEAGVSLQECAFFGDNFNDVAAVKAAGIGIAVASKCEDLTRECDLHIADRCLAPLKAWFQGPV